MCSAAPRSFLCGTLALALLVPGAAHAQGWADHLDPDRARGERLLRRAMEHVACAIGTDACASVEDAFLAISDVALQEIEWEQALVRLERARRYLPDDPEVLYLRAIALSRWEREEHGVVSRRVEDAIAAFEELRARHPEVAPTHVAFELAILRTRQRDFGGAAAEYELAAAATRLPGVMTIPPTARPLHHLVAAMFFLPLPITELVANWAEVTMLSGDAERAIDLYQQAVDAAEHWPNTALARFGLSLALERAGAHDAAIAAMREALDVPVPLDSDDPMASEARELVARFGSFAPLHAEGVFFEPACEMRAYEALGNEELASEARSAEGRRRRLEDALRSWRAYLAEGGRDERWAARAEEAITRLEARIAAMR